MKREERRRILGDEVIAHIHARVAEAPTPPPEVLQRLRRIISASPPQHMAEHLLGPGAPTPPIRRTLEP